MRLCVTGLQVADSRMMGLTSDLFTTAAGSDPGFNCFAILVESRAEFL